MTTLYSAGSNIPGYLPMADEPTTFDTREEAIAYLEEELDRVLDGVGASSDLEDDAIEHDPRYFDLDTKVQEIRDDGWADIPNTGGEHDLGVRYWVEEVEHDVDADDHDNGCFYCLADV